MRHRIINTRLFFSMGMLAVILAALLGMGRVASASPVSSHGQLSVANGRIVDEEGRRFVIKGVSTHGLAWYPQYVQKKSFASLKKKGVNAIRLALYTEEYNGYCNSGSENQENLKKLLDKGVNAATELGMYVIIDWHILSDGNPLSRKKEAKSFFAAMAKKYKDYSNVLFEICNEPNGDGGSWENIRSYAKTIIRTIRSCNKKAIIIVGTPTWCQEVDKAVDRPLPGKNIVYAFHFYAGTHRQDLRDRLESALKKKLPVLVSEFGITDASGNGGINKAEGNRWMKLLNRYKVGRVCWNLSNKEEDSALLKSSCSRVSGWKSSDWSVQARWLWKQY